MNRLSICLTCFIYLALCGVVCAETETSSATFEMKYRSFNGTQSELFKYSRLMFSSRNIKPNAFIRNLRKQGMEIEIVPMKTMLRAQQAAMEIVSGTLAALYVDLNADGKLSPGERITPSGNPGRGKFATEFVTPDFTMNTKQGKMPYRLLLDARSGRSLMSDSKYRYSWGPSCVWEGQSEVDGKPVTLRLVDGRMDGTLTEFGRDMIGFEGMKPLFSWGPWQQMSSLMYLDNCYYRLSFTGEPREGGNFRAILTRDTSPQGKLEVTLTDGRKSALKNVDINIRDSNDNACSLQLKNQPFPSIPEGMYKVSYGTFECNDSKGKPWTYQISGGSMVEIEADETCTLELGSPYLLVDVYEVVVEGKKKSRKLRASIDGIELAPITAGSMVEIDVTVMGDAGESYRRIARKAAGPGMKNRKAAESPPLVQIANSKGVQVAEYKLVFG
jgi:hypothetical protein